MIDIIRNITKNKKMIILFEIIYVALGIFVFFPFFVQLFSLALKISPYNVVTATNTLNFLFYPTTIIFLIIICFIWALYALVEFVFLAIIFDRRYERKGFRHLLNSGYYYFLNIFKRKNIPLLLFIMLVIPFYSFALSLFGFPSLQLPVVFITSIKKSLVLRIVFCFLFIVILLLTFLFFFIYHFFTIEEMTFTKAAKNSIKLIKKSFKEIAQKTCLMNIFLIMGIVTTYFLIGIVVAIFVHVFGSDEKLSVFLSIMYIVNTLIKAIFKCLFIVLNYSILTNIFNRNYQSEKSINSLSSKRHKIIVSSVQIIFSILLVVNSFIYFINYNKTIWSSVLGNNIIEISAHRGCPYDAPENSIPSFLIAIEKNVDYVELDLCKTKDDVIVVFHDKSISRMCDAKGNITKLNYDEIKHYDIGKNFPEYQNTYIPTFAEVLEEISGKVKINIEIKNYSYNDEYLNNIYNLMVEYDIVDSSVVTSTSKTILKKMKLIDKDIITGYIFTYGYGEYANDKNIDFMSMDYRYVTQEVVDEIHSLGKEIHVWTPNNKEAIANMISYGVDNIITDNVDLANKMIFYEYSGYITKQVIKAFFPKEGQLAQLFN